VLPVPVNPEEPLDEVALPEPDEPLDLVEPEDPPVVVLEELAQ